MSRSTYAVASDYMSTSGADITTNLQSFADAMWAQGREVWLGNGDYQISQLKIPTGGVLRLRQGARIIRVNKTTLNRTNALIRNATLTTGNTDITVEGGTFLSEDQNGTIFGFQSVDRLNLREFDIADYIGDWAVNVALCRAVNINDFVIRGGTSGTEDGVHIGGGKNINIANGHIESGDDCVALNTFTDLVALEQVVGLSNLSNVNVTNITGVSATAALLKIILDAATATSGQTIRNINVDNISGTSTSTSRTVLIGDETTSGVHGVQDVRISRLNIDNTGSTNKAVSFTNAKDCTISDSSADSQVSALHITDACQNITASNFTGTGTTASDHAALIEGGSTHIVLRDCNITNTAGSAGKGITISASSHVSVLGGSARGNTTGAAVRLIDSSRCAVIGADCAAGGTGISESGTSDYNRYIGNDLRACTTKKSTVGANDVITGNIE